MKSITSVTVLFIILIGGTSFAEDDQPAENSYDKYKAIYEQNMFSKNRRPPRNERQARQVETTRTLAIYILRGIAAEEGRAHKVAFIEEQISGQSQTAEIGTTILDGRITKIHLDYILFEENGTTRKIKLGAEIGTSSTTVMVDAEETDEPGETETKAEEETTEDSSSTEEGDTLKKLMERRKRELGT